jgi:hypothetical protein
MNIDKIYIPIKNTISNIKRGDYNKTSFIYFIMFILFVYSSVYINPNLFILSISFDGIFNGVHFAKYYIKKDLTESNIITNIPDIYNIDLISRYEYYLLLNFVAFILLPLTLFIRTIIIYLLIIPQVVYKINTSNYGQYIKEKKNLFLKKFLSKQISKYIKKYSNNDLKIHYKEIIPLWSSVNNIESMCWSVIKNLLIITAVNYLKQNYSNMSYNVIKKFYTYKTGVKINTLSLQEAKDNIKNIIINKSWDKLYDVQFTNSLKIVYIDYSNKVSGSYIKSLQFKILYFFSLWSFGFILPLFLVPVLYASFEIYRSPLYINSSQLYTNSDGTRSLVPLVHLLSFIIHKIKTVNSRKHCYKVANLLLSFVLSILYNQEILIISFITVFGYPLLFNDLTFSILQKIWKQQDFIIKIHTDCTNIILVIIFATVTTLIALITSISVTNVYIFGTITIMSLIPMLYHLQYQLYHKKIFLLFTLLTIVNNFNINTILINSYIFHIINNIINYYIRSKRIYIDSHDYSIIFLNNGNTKPPRSSEPIPKNYAKSVEVTKAYTETNNVIDDVGTNNVIEDIGTNNVVEDTGTVDAFDQYLTYSIDNSYYNFTIKNNIKSSLEESIIMFR